MVPERRYVGPPTLTEQTHAHTQRDSRWSVDVYVSRTCRWSRPTGLTGDHRDQTTVPRHDAVYSTWPCHAFKLSIRCLHFSDFTRPSAIIATWHTRATTQVNGGGSFSIPWSSETLIRFSKHLARLITSAIRSHMPKTVPSPPPLNGVG